FSPHTTPTAIYPPSLHDALPISGLFRAEAIALVGEVLEARRVADAFLDHVAGHQAAGLLGVEADDLVLAVLQVAELGVDHPRPEDRKSTRLNSSHVKISYAVFCL